MMQKLKVSVVLAFLALGLFACSQQTATNTSNNGSLASTANKTAEAPSPACPNFARMKMAKQGDEVLLVEETEAVKMPNGGLGLDRYCCKGDFTNCRRTDSACSSSEIIVWKFLPGKLAPLS
jgi:hypothetical protein